MKKLNNYLVALFFFAFSTANFAMEANGFKKPEEYLKIVRESKGEREKELTKALAELEHDHPVDDKPVIETEEDKKSFEFSALKTHTKEYSDTQLAYLQKHNNDNESRKALLAEMYVAPQQLAKDIGRRAITINGKEINTTSENPMEVFNALAKELVSAGSAVNLFEVAAAAVYQNLLAAGEAKFSKFKFEKQDKDGTFLAFIDSCGVKKELVAHITVTKSHVTVEQVSMDPLVNANGDESKLIARKTISVITKFNRRTGEVTFSHSVRVKSAKLGLPMFTWQAKNVNWIVEPEKK